MPSDASEEFDEDMASPLRDLSSASPRSLRDQQFTYYMADVEQISNELGILWEPEKDIAFSTVFPFIGFLWNLQDKTVSIPQSKRDK
jgi:hypothetical protein